LIEEHRDQHRHGHHRDRCHVYHDGHHGHDQQPSENENFKFQKLKEYNKNITVADVFDFEAFEFKSFFAY